MKKKKESLLKNSNLGKKRNICSVCGKPYDYQVRVHHNPDGTKICLHDGEFPLGGPGLSFSRHDKKIISKLPKSKVLVKGADGVSRICDVAKK